MALHRLVFDTTSTATQNDSANVGAYLRSSDGTLLTHTTVGADEGLDTFILNASLTVDAVDLDIRDLSSATDNVAIGDGLNQLTINGDGSLNAIVAATDLDIRDLTHVSDSVSLGDGTDLFTSTTVGADVGLDTFIINAALNVNLQDGAGTDLTSTLNGGKQSLDVNITGADIEIDVEDDLANTALTTAAETINTTSSALITSPLAARRFVWLYNNHNRTVYIGPSGVSAATGFPIFSGGLLEMRLGAAVAIHAETESGTGEMRVMQAS